MSQCWPWHRLTVVTSVGDPADDVTAGAGDVTAGLLAGMGVAVALAAENSPLSSSSAALSRCRYSEASRFRPWASNQAAFGRRRSGDTWGQRSGHNRSLEVTEGQVTVGQVTGGQVIGGPGHSRSLESHQVTGGQVTAGHWRSGHYRSLKVRSQQVTGGQVTADHWRSGHSRSRDF